MVISTIRKNLYPWGITPEIGAGYRYYSISGCICAACTTRLQSRKGLADYCEFRLIRD